MSAVDFFISYAGADEAWAEWVAFGGPQRDSDSVTWIWQPGRSSCLASSGLAAHFQSGPPPVTVSKLEHSRGTPPSRTAFFQVGAVSAKRLFISLLQQPVRAANVTQLK